MAVQPAQFDGHNIRRVYDEESETWWFSVIDVVEVLTGSSNANRYWSDLKRKLAQEAGSGQPYEEIVRLKMLATDGKSRETDCAKAATFAETDDATGMAENTEAATKGGAIARQARKALEAKTGKPVVTGENFLPPGRPAPRKVAKKP